MIKTTFQKLKQTGRQPAADLAADVDGVLQPLVLPPLPLPPLVLLLFLPPGLDIRFEANMSRIFIRYEANKTGCYSLFSHEANHRILHAKRIQTEANIPC